MYLNEYIIFISILWYTFILILAGAVIAVCFKIKVTPLLWTMLAAYAVEHFVYVLINEIIFIGIAEYNFFHAGDSIVFWLSLAANAAVCAVTYYAVYRIFKPNLSYLDNYFIGDTYKTRIFFALFLAIFFASTLLNQQNAQNTSTGLLNYLSAVSDLINCLFVLLVQYIGLTTSRINSEKQISYKLLEDEKKQFDAFKNSVDYLNIKCHDLKHEIRRIQTSGVVDNEKLDDIAKEVALYEAFAKTGNETLDIILTEKNLACIAGGIAFSFMADASSLKIMEASEIYSLFGNLLDNAIEYVEKIADKDKRFIRLFVRPQGNMLLIHEENYIDDVSLFNGGLPRTTKEDKLYHGFGIKSMIRTAQKYGGDLKITAEENMFKADIFIQVA